MWKRLVNLIKKQWNPLKKMLSKNWLLFVNYVVVFVTYSNVYGHEEFVGMETLLGIWLFVSAAYGCYKLFIKK